MELLSSLFHGFLEFIVYNLFGPLIFLLDDMGSDAALMGYTYLWLAGFAFLMWFMSYRPLEKLRLWNEKRQFYRKLEKLRTSH